MPLVVSFLPVFSQRIHITNSCSVVETILSCAKAALEAAKAKGAALRVLLL